MSRSITLDLPETVLDQLESEAKGQGMTTADWIVFTLTEQYRLQDEVGSSQGPTPMTSPITPTQRPGNGRANDAEADEARKRFRRHFGRLLTDLHQTITRLGVVLVWLEVASCRV
jgi:hypothetical protein